MEHLLLLLFLLASTLTDRSDSLGWLADNLWLQGAALTLQSLSLAYDLTDTEVRRIPLYLSVGLTIGALVWGVLADVIGRKTVFKSTLLVAAVFGTSVGSSNSWKAACGLYAALGAGVGGR